MWLNAEGMASGSWRDDDRGWVLDNDPDTGSSAPARTENSQNGLPALDFVKASHHRLKETHDAETGPADSVFDAISIAVLATNHDISGGHQYIVANTAYYADFSLATSGDPAQLSLRSTSGAGAIIVSSNAAPTVGGSSSASDIDASTTGGATVSYDVPNVLIVNRDTGADEDATVVFGQRINGVRGSTLTLSGNGNRQRLNNADMYVGSRSGTSGNEFDGLLYEVIIFWSDSTDLKEKIEGYLQHKFALTSLSSGHTYKNVPPLDGHTLMDGSLANGVLSRGFIGDMTQKLNLYDCDHGQDYVINEAMETNKRTSF